MELRDLVAVLWKRRALVVLVVVLTGLLSALFAFSRAERYESTATIALTPNLEQNAGFVSPDTLDALVGTYAQTAKAAITLDKARDAIGGPLPGEIETSTEPGTGILEIIGKADTAENAATTARAVSDAFVESLRTNPLLVAQVVNPPVPATEPVAPHPPLIVAVGLLLGLLAGAMLAYVVEQLRRRIETSADVAEFTSAPVVGRLPRERALARSGSGLVWDRPELAGAQEAFRALRTNVELLTKKHGTVLQVTSPLPGEGKSTLIANFGVALAQVGIETLIVDADLRRPVQHKIFGVENRLGLSTLMVDPGSEPPAVATAYPNLSLIPSGPIPPSSTEMLHIRFAAVVAALRETGAIVLVDSPPILPISDARLIASEVDSVLLVLAAGRDRPAALRGTIETLELAGANLLGVVLNHSDEDAGAGGYGNYGAYAGKDAVVSAEQPEYLKLSR